MKTVVTLRERRARALERRRGAQRRLDALLEEAGRQLGADGIAFHDHRRAAKRRHLEARGQRGPDRRAQTYLYYSDRYSVFQVNRQGAEGQPTQSSRALRTLNIAAIHAGSPPRRRTGAWSGPTARCRTGW